MGFGDFVEIMRRLREGCPWDRKQTSASLRPYLIEEAYELLEAIDSGKADAVREELGDLLLQIVFHARIAEERGEFTMDDVVEGISQKMISRHPHVFGDAKYETPEEVVGQWEQRKREEGKLRDSLLSGVPHSMPALLRAQRLQSRAAKVGFDWSRVEEVLAKVEEEMAEFREALKGGRKDEVQDELGDIFFALVNVSRFLEIDSEAALRGTIAKFIKRFRHIEMAAEAAGRSMNEMSLDEMEALWQESKKDDSAGL